MITKEIILNTLNSQTLSFQQLGVKNIGLFGSFLRDQQTEKSDIDLLVEFYPEFENFNNLMSLYDLLELLFENRKIEIVTKNGLSPFIGPHILNQTQYV
jgi:predicted nucleotidyltransferase